MRSRCPRSLLLALVLCTTGCTLAVHVPANVRVGGSPGAPPPAPVAAASASPRIVSVWLSETTIAPMQRFAGTVTTSTNVASVEMRTETFSYNVPRLAFGQFAFHYVMPELPPPARRHYLLWIIARNAAGVEDVEGVPIFLK
ncbi:MAG TPA: hypothetical protein VMV82_05535 [Candidatus Dormibacteraeota bacterium]|nr:hypothetical protein [Candidatus Dormibacteraeota bacterium]